MDFLRKSESADKSMPTYPAQALALHVAIRGAQLGSCIGLAASIVSAPFNRKTKAPVWRRVMVPCTLVGIAVSSSVLYYKHYSEELEAAGVDDRALRIVTNKEIAKVDRYSLAGFASGAVGGVIVGRHFFSFSCTGLALGFVFHFVQKEWIKNKNSKTLEMYAPKWVKKE